MPPEQFVQKAMELNADVIGLSSLLTTGDPHVKATVEAIKKSELASRVKVICGGAAVTEKFADRTAAPTATRPTPWERWRSREDYWISINPLTSILVSGTV